MSDKESLFNIGRHLSSFEALRSKKIMGSLAVRQIARKTSATLSVRPKYPQASGFREQDWPGTGMPGKGLNIPKCL